MSLKIALLVFMVKISLRDTSSYNLNFEDKSCFCKFVGGGIFLRTIGLKSGKFESCGFVPLIIGRGEQ